MALLIRTQFGDLNFDTALPAIREIIQNKFEQKPSIVDRVYNIQGSNRSVEQSTGITGFKRFVETPEGDMHAGDLAFQRYDKTFTHLKYTLGFSFTRELVDDDQFGVVARYSEALGRSGFDTRETHGAEIYNEAFSATNFVGGDGKELCATNHPLVAGTEQNELTTPADLSVTSLQQAINDLQDTTDDRGLLLNVKPEMLLVPNELQWTAHELLKSVLLPDTANNNANSVRELSGVSPLVWNYLTDPDAWFLVANSADHNVIWYDRDSLEINDYDKPEIEAKVIVGRMRYSRGWNDWRGIFGTPGA